MVCYHPLTMYWTGRHTENGKREYTFNINKGYCDMSIQVPCGKCIGCKLDKSRQNGLRIMDEASQFENNCFISLTVGDKYLDRIFPGGDVIKKPFQDFAKRLRKRFDGLQRVSVPDWWQTSTRGAWNEFPIRIVYCGEYGDENGRPHYHAALMNFDFIDKQFYKLSDAGNRLYLSESLSELWPFGMCDIGDLNFQSAFYLARYTLKKQGSEQVDYNDGVIHTPPFVVYPARFGVGRLWYDKYKSDLYGLDAHYCDGRLYKVPRFYDKKYELTAPDDMAMLKKHRLMNYDVQSPERLAVQEELQEIRVRKLKRSL